MSTAIYTLKVGKRLFRLAADAMRAHSIAVQRFEPLTATVLKGLEDFLAAPDQEAKIAKSLAFDEAGDIRISLRVQLSHREVFNAARLRISGTDPEPASVRLTLAVGLVCIFSTAPHELAGTERLKVS